MISIKDSVLRRSNDYSSAQEDFKKRSGYELVPGKKQSVNLKFSNPVSIIVSCYKGNRALPLLFKALKKQTYKEFEVILIDDGSPESMLDTTISENADFEIKYVHQSKNMGHTFTRNTGIFMSNYETLIIMDQDIIPNANFVKNFAVRQLYTHDCVFIGFKEDIDLEKYNPLKQADYNKDWRFHQKGEEHFLHLAITDKQQDDNSRTFHLVKETNNFKNFGNGTVIGFWDLPCMVISHSLSVKKSSAIIAGGFPEKIFKGWGIHDIAFGARLIAHNQFIIPVVENTSYHINHERYSGSREIEMEELKANLNVYRKFINYPVLNYNSPKRNIKYVKRHRNVEVFEVYT